MDLSLSRSGELEENTENTVWKYMYSKTPAEEISDYQLYQIAIRRTDELHILRQMLEVKCRVDEKLI